MSHATLVLDDFATAESVARWTVFTDRVMGGVSVATAALEVVAGRRALRLTGRVSLERNGGFVQVARALADPPDTLDASGTGGLVLDVCGAPGSYFVHLRTIHTRAPWQHYRASLPVTAAWHTVTLPWTAFAPAGLAQPLDVRGLTRIGLVGGQAAFDADLALARLAMAPLAMTRHATAPPAPA